MLYEEILNNLSEIIENRNNDDDIVYKIFSFANNVIQNKEIVLEENPNISKEHNENMATKIFSLYVRKDKTGYISLSFGQKYLDTYKKNSPSHYVILIHELKHIFDYYSNKDNFFNFPPKEKLYYEIEARKIEYLFIKNYLVGNYQLTKLENYILDSYDNDDLEAYNIIIQKDSSAMYQYIIDMETEFKNNKISKQQIIEKIILKIDPLIEKSNIFLPLFTLYQEKVNNFQNYADFTRLKTFYKYYEMVILSIFNNTNPLELQEHMYKLISILKEQDQSYHFYSLSLDNYFENDIISL
jgi:hypothetical protein